MASHSTSVILSDHFATFAAEQVKSGRYGSVSEVVRAGLRRLEVDEQKLAALREAIRIGDESGPSQAFDMRAWMNEEYPARSCAD